MLSLTKKTDYALIALAYLSKHGVEQGRVAATSAREIAQNSGVALPVMMNVLKELAKARLVKSNRGSTGGYTLVAAPGQISVLEVVTAMEGPVKLAQCVDDLPIMGQGCPIACSCGIQSAIHRLHDRLNDFLSQTTLADLVDQPAPIGIGTV